jgi:hypothetical protein
MKRKISFFIVFIFIFVFSGCDDAGVNSKGGKTNSGSNSSWNGREVEIIFEKFGTYHKGISFKYVEKEKWGYYRNLITNEMKKYPTGYYNTIGPFRIAIVIDLHLNGIAVNGCANSNNKIIFINIARTQSDNAVNYFGNSQILHIYHHEQHHYAEYSIWGSYYWQEWEKLYTGKYDSSFDIDEFINWKPSPGFYTYSQTLDPKEDRAVIASDWFNDNELLITTAKKDTVLDQKITLLLKLLKDRLSFSDPLREYNQKMGR